MTNLSILQRVTGVHPGIVLAGSATAAWIVSGLWTLDASPAAAKPAPAVSKAPTSTSTPTVAFNGLPAQLPDRLNALSSAAPVSVTPLPSTVIVASTGPTGGNGGDSGGSGAGGASQQSQRHSSLQAGQQRAQATAPVKRSQFPTPWHEAGPAAVRPRSMPPAPAPAPVYAPQQQPWAGIFRAAPFRNVGGGRFGGGGGGRHR